MDQIKLRTYDGIAFTGFLMLPALFSTILSKLTEQNSSAVWIALLIAFASMLCLFLICACLVKRYAGKNILEITAIVMGKPIGIVYGMVLGVYFCFFTGIHIRESTEILKIYGLSLTPVYVVAGLILLAAVIMNFFGGHAIVKSAGFFFLIVVIGIIFIVLLGLSRYNPDNLVPILGNGIPNIIKNGLGMTSVFDGILILFLFAPAFASTDSMKKSGILSLLFNAVAYILLSVCFVMMFSPSIGSQMMSGVMEMGKSSYYNHFFYRFESIFLFFLIFSAIMQAAIGLFVARKSITCSLKRKSSKIMTVICSVPVIFAIFLPANILDLTQKYLPIIRQYSVFFMAGFPLLVLFISIIKRSLKLEKH